MNEQTGAGTVNPEQTSASPAVNTANPNSTPAGTGTPADQGAASVTRTETNTNDSQTVQTVQPKMVMFDDYALPEPVYKEIKLKSFSEGQRIRDKELLAAGKIKTDEDHEQLEAFKRISTVFGDHIKPGHPVTPESFTDFVKKIKADTEHQFRDVIDTRDKEITRIKEEKDTILEKHKKVTIESVLKTTLSNQGVLPEAMNDVVFLLMSRGQVQLDEDMEGIVVYSENGEKSFDNAGNPKGIEQLVIDYKASHPSYFKGTEKGGTGREYGVGKVETLTGIGAKLHEKAQQNLRAMQESQNRREPFPQHR